MLKLKYHVTYIVMNNELKTTKIKYMCSEEVNKQKNDAK